MSQWVQGGLEWSARSYHIEYRESVKSMDNLVITLSLQQLALAFIPVALTVLVVVRWSMEAGNVLYALFRMLIQLLLVGYALAWIFGAQSGWLILLVLAIMILASSWIALRTVPERRWKLLTASLVSIVVGGGFTLVFTSQAVLQLDPWYMPRYLVPLAGMVFANSMTAVSLAAERLYAELEHGGSWGLARDRAFQAAMIPVVNSLFAVGLVSLPGMMTGQILSGISPLVAARYQIVVMCMIFTSAGLATAIFLSITQHVIAKESKTSSV
ncbi:MAG: putative ABC transport system permease protein [Halieaceae bacterium]|jgi:putative ABC transport system permease protein